MVQYKLYDFTPENQEKLETIYVAKRDIELQVNPIKGAFDQEHLKEINRFLFQDMPKLGPEWANTYKPGIFRYLEFQNHDWIKCRPIKSVNVNSIIAYSRMDDNTLKELDDILREADPQKLSLLSQEDFAKKISDIYVKLDYIHPFYDGNSRTLRFFTQDLARKAGFELNWAINNESQITRDKLYIARDISVYEISKDKIQNKENFREVTYSYDRFSENPKVEDILKNCITKIKTPKISLSDHQALPADNPDDINADKILNEVLESERLQKSLLASQEYNESLDNYIGAEKTKIKIKVMEIDRCIQRQEKSLNKLNQKQPGLLTSKSQKEKLGQARNRLKGNIQKLTNDKSQIRRRLDEDILLKEFREDNPELSNARDLEEKQKVIKTLEQAEQNRKIEQEERKKRQQGQGLARKLSITPNGTN